MTNARTTSEIAGKLSTGSACSNCDVTYSKCTEMIFTERRGCCDSCYSIDTHDVKSQELTAWAPCVFCSNDKKAARYRVSPPERSKTILHVCGVHLARAVAHVTVPNSFAHVERLPL